jgi:hypothetical protein
MSFKSKLIFAAFALTSQNCFAQLGEGNGNNVGYAKVEAFLRSAASPYSIWGGGTGGSGGQSPDGPNTGDSEAGYEGGRECDPALDEERKKACQAWKDLVAQSLNKQGTPASQVSKAVSDSTTVVFIGEVHNNQASRNQEAALVRQLAEDHGFDCLAIEAPAGSMLYEEVTSKDTATACKKAVDLGFGENAVAPWIQAAYEARCHGMKVYAYDSPTAWTMSDTNPSDIQSRNNFMISMLRAMMAGPGGCKKVVTLNGDLHLFMSTVNGSLTSLPALAAQAGIDYRVVHLQGRDQSIGMLSPQGLGPLGCEWTGMLTKPVVINGPASVDGLYDTPPAYGTLVPFVLDEHQIIAIY